MAIEVLSVSENKRVRRYIPSSRSYNMSWKEYEGKARLYVSIDEANDGRSGSLTQMEHLLFDRYTNPVDLYKEMLPSIFDKLGLYKVDSARWSQKAGCSCPCSPGFILTGPGLVSVDYWATIGDPAAVEAAKAYRASTKALQVQRQSRAMLTNAQRAFAQGESVVRVKELSTYVSEYDPKAWKAAY